MDAHCESFPANTRFFKVPHHGSANGTFTSVGTTPWLSAVPAANVGISSHVRPFNHPDQRVVNILRQSRTFRTDQHYQITVETDGTAVSVRYRPTFDRDHKGTF